MSTLDTVIAALPETQLMLASLLGWLHTQGRLVPLVREALAAQLGQQQARPGARADSSPPGGARGTSFWAWTIRCGANCGRCGCHRPRPGPSRQPGNIFDFFLYFSDK